MAKTAAPDTYILAVESSCDETGIAIYHATKGLVANQLHSQVDLHAIYGGVVPELASRDHVKRLAPLFDAALAQAGISAEQLSAVAYTAGPGLIGALIVGAQFARTLAWSLDIPAIAINHLEGHLMAPFLEEQKPSYPFLGVLISGGHSQFVLVRGHRDYEVLGQSIDDAVGEAFDKTAKLLGFPYPGGKALSQLAESGNPDFSFTPPMIKQPGVDLSFSGLKTAALTKKNEFIKANKEAGLPPELTQQQKADIARAFENCVVRTFTIKIKRAIELMKEKVGKKVQQIVMVGGVSANKRLRAELAKEFGKLKIAVMYARPEFCVDNGAMIAMAGWFEYERKYLPAEQEVFTQALAAAKKADKPVVLKKVWTYKDSDNSNLLARWSLNTLKKAEALALPEGEFFTLHERQELLQALASGKTLTAFYADKDKAARLAQAQKDSHDVSGHGFTAGLDAEAEPAQVHQASHSKHKHAKAHAHKHAREHAHKHGKEQAKEDSQQQKVEAKQHKPAAAQRKPEQEKPAAKHNPVKPKHSREYDEVQASNPGDHIIAKEQSNRAQAKVVKGNKQIKVLDPKLKRVKPKPKSAKTTGQSSKSKTDTK